TRFKCDWSSDVCSSDLILTRAALENSIRALHSISGSTNAMIHLIAYAGRLGIELPLSLFDELCESTPWLVNLKPAGDHLMEDFRSEERRVGNGGGKGVW